MKSPVELNSLYQYPFLILPDMLQRMIRQETGRIANEVFTSNPIVSSKQ